MKTAKWLRSGIVLLASAVMFTAVNSMDACTVQAKNEIAIQCDAQTKIVCPSKKGKVKWTLKKGKKKLKIVRISGKNHRIITVKGLKIGKCILVARCKGKTYKYRIRIMKKTSVATATPYQEPAETNQPSVSPPSASPTFPPQYRIEQGYAGFYPFDYAPEWNTHIYYIRWENKTSESITVKDSLKIYASSYLVSSKEAEHEYEIAPGAGVDMKIMLPMNPGEYIPESSAHYSKWTRLVMDEVTASDLSVVRTELPYHLIMVPAAN